jgi:hypothetical protein
MLFASTLLFVTSQVAFGQSALSNGGNHAGTLQVGGLDSWTFSATRNDGITLSLGKVLGGGSDPNFNPWIRLKGPDGAQLAADFGQFENFSTVDVRAPSTGTYTVLVANSNTSQTGPVNYVLTLAKTPGPYVVSAGDEGGPLTNGSHSGSLGVGDVDAWAVQAAANDSITVSLGKVLSGGSDPNFNPWLRVKGPDGAFLGADFGQFENVSTLDVRAPSTGTYTVLVANSNSSQVTPTSYVLTLAGPNTGYSVAAILAVAGSAQGNGAFFRTRVQMYNPRTGSISGKLVFHAQGVSGGPNDPSLNYTLAAGQTIDYTDLLPAMGISGGLGSIDIMTNPGDPVPVMSARIFSDGGANGSAGFFIDPLGPDAALQAGDSGVLIAPADPVAARLNIGVRSLETGASILVTVRNRNGGVRNTVTKTYGPTFFEQVNANSYVGVNLDASDTITFSVNSGKAIIYGAQTDNKTQDPSVQYAKRTL